MIRGFFATVQNLISDIIGKDTSTSDGSDPGYFPSGPHSMPNTPSSSSEPKPEVYHGLLIFHEDDQEEALVLQTRLNQLRLRNGQMVRVAIEDDMLNSGQTETESFNSYFHKNILFFLFITESFIKSKIHKWKSDVGLSVSLTYGSTIDRERFVVPIFTEDKITAPYLMNDHILQAVIGIKYHGCNWTELTKRSFMRNFEEAERRLLLMVQGSSVDS